MIEEKRLQIMEQDCLAQFGSLAIHSDTYKLITEVRRLQVELGVAMQIASTPKRTQAHEDINYLLAFTPEWAKEAPPGLAPMSYGTLTQEGDQKVIDEVREIRKRWGI